MSESLTPELIMKVLDLVANPPCNQHGNRCIFWDVQGHYCYLSPLDGRNCELVTKLLLLYPDVEAIKREERERIYKLWQEDTNDGELPTSLGFTEALAKGE